VKGASEAFLASTTRELQAVAQIDGSPLPEAPGPRTREAQEAFAAARDAELEAAVN
jgi:branched-chain amino acid aminotransferase